LSVIVKHLEKSYEIPVIKGIDLEVPQGQILGIIGRSGAGKSTLLRCLNGLEQPTSGSISIDGKYLTNVTDHERRSIQQKIGNVFQSFNLLSRLTVLENVVFPLKLINRSKEDLKSKALNLLDLVGLKEKAAAYPSQLSGGQSQRVAIARALISDVSLLLCDEFTSALDFETSLEILELLRDLNKRLGITIILITHDMAIVHEICDEVCVIEDGRIVEKNDIASILLHPVHIATKSLIRNLVNKDLPHHLQEILMPEPAKNSDVLLRLLFSSEPASEPVIAALVKKYDVPINILVGKLDHVRETAFGSLIISMPSDKANLQDIMADLDQRSVSAEILGYLPRGGTR
jgi:D-methionine transport system ATP-binding protein